MSGIKVVPAGHDHSVVDVAFETLSALLFVDSVRLAGDAAIVSAVSARVADLTTPTALETGLDSDGFATLALTLAKKDAAGFEAEFKKLAVVDNAEEWTLAEKLNLKVESGTDKHGDLYKNTRLGRVLKPAENASKREREIDGLRKLQATKLAHLLPEFYGERWFNDEWHLEMSDLLHGLRGPVASFDIKMGRKTWDDDAPADKQEKEAAKIVPGKCSDLGFRLVGMRAGDHKLSHYEIRQRGDLSKEEFLTDGMDPFFRLVRRQRRKKAAAEQKPEEAAEKMPEEDAEEAKPEEEEYRFSRRHFDALLAELRSLLAVLREGYGGVLRASSLFVAREMTGNRIVIKFIDFAHYTPTDGLDDNLIDGYQNLLSTLEEYGKTKGAPPAADVKKE